MPLFKRKEITFRNDVQMHNVSEKDQNIKCTLHTHQFCYMVTELRIQNNSKAPKFLNGRVKSWFFT